LKKILIRRFKKGDAPCLKKIEEAITKKTSTIDFKRVVKEVLERDADASFVAEVDGRVVGYMISHLASGNFGLDKSAWIAMFSVEPKFMGQGIGKRLSEEIFKVYKEQGITNVFTSVRWDSIDILSFFKSIGFERSDFIHLWRGLG
jgi:ribosomal protein S18 acetylase RimI-like enzyme